MSTDVPLKVLLAAPRGFCAGVERAIEIVERALDQRGAPVFVRKQIVHNIHVVGDLESRGAIFVEELDEVPDGATVVFSAHGISPAVRRRAADQLRQDHTGLAPAADARLLERELEEAVRQAVRSLPAAQREVVELRQRRELTFQQIADRLGRPLGTVLSQMRAALARISADLESYR